MFLQDFNRTALIIDDKEISYKSLMDSICQYSSLLGISKGERVALLAENRPEWVYAFYSIWNKRGIPVPIDHQSTSEEVNYILSDAAPAYMFCSDLTHQLATEAAEGLTEKPIIINLDSLKAEYKRENLNLTPESMHEIALIIYTSGTTGSPKGVMLSFDNLMSNIECVLEDKIYDLGDRMLAILPMHHALPLQGTMLMPLMAGGTVIFLSQITADEILKNFQKHKITLLLGVPRLYNLFHAGIMKKIKPNKVASTLLKISRAMDSYSFGKKVFKKVQDTFGGHIKYCISGGAKLDEDVARDYKAFGFKILEGYGMTEASPMISYNPPKKIKIGSAGKIIPDATVKIVDGEITVSGRLIMQGYFNKPEETAQILRDGWLYTGDLGELDEEGYIYITGRRKEIIILPNGKNINPEEIEKKIMEISGVIKEVGVIQKDNQLFAIIYPDFPLIEKMNIHNIQEMLKWDILDKYNMKASHHKKVLNFTIVNSELPKTRLGKIKRYTLHELLVKEQPKASQGEIPTYLEYKLLEEYLKGVVKKDILPDEHVELDLGLDSLDKVELQVQIEKTFGVTLTDEDLSVHSTVRKLADYIKAKKTKIENEVIHWGTLLKEDIQFDVPRSTYMLKLLKFLVGPFFKFYIRIEKEGLENIPAQTPVILAPNHQSFIDGLLIAESLKNRTLNRTYFFAKEKHIKNWFTKFFARNSNVLVMNINKELKQTLQRLAVIIKRGNNMVIFPEGVRSRDGQLTNFKKSFAILSKELNVPVVPVAIQGAYEKFSIGSKFPKPGKIKLKFLKPIYPGDKDYEAIASQAQQNIAMHI